jgi:hypothetical protein
MAITRSSIVEGQRVVVSHESSVGRGGHRNAAGRRAEASST